LEITTTIPLVLIGSVGIIAFKANGMEANSFKERQ
jgi:hypothetical protein